MNARTLTHLSLFSGIGGLDLAAEWAGFQTVGQCEIADYAAKILARHWPDVARWRDIHTLTRGDFFEKTGLRTVDVISGGFPCQPFSVAGKQKGKGDDRYLWPELLRVVAELTPRWVVGENVPGILRIAATDVVKDLERAGYDVAVFDFEAAAVGAPHRRERIAFVANRDGAWEQQPRGERTEIRGRTCNSGKAVADPDGRGRGKPDVQNKQSRRTETGGGSKAMADAGGERLQRCQQHERNTKKSDCGKKRFYGTASECRKDLSDTDGEMLHGEVGNREQAGRSGFADGMQWAIEPNVGRVANGVPNRVDRLKCLGNAVVPQQFYPIFRAIYMTEMEKERE